VKQPRICVGCGKRFRAMSDRLWEWNLRMHLLTSKKHEKELNSLTRTYTFRTIMSEKLGGWPILTSRFSTLGWGSSGASAGGEPAQAELGRGTLVSKMKRDSLGSPCGE
jgi:hypothetical protein